MVEAFQQIAAATADDATSPVPLILRLADGMGEPLRAKLERDGLEGLSTAERTTLVTRLMLQHNKVTHIYEMIRGSGAGAQLRYDRGSRSWVRQDSIAAKHEREYAVDPLEGRYQNGPAHAPLIVAGDPRRSTPAQLRRVLEEALQGCDERVVGGWTQAMSGPQALTNEVDK